MATVVAQTVNLAGKDLTIRETKRVFVAFNQKRDILENVNVQHLVQEKKPLTFCETRVKGDSNLKQLHSL
jgi:hypothetical protein